jgi:hypothetical protein
MIGEPMKSVMVFTFRGRQSVNPVKYLFQGFIPETGITVMAVDVFKCIFGQAVGLPHQTAGFTDIPDSCIVLYPDKILVSVSRIDTLYDSIIMA